jgi:hypothetical protein
VQFGEITFGGGPDADFVLPPDHFSVDACNFFTFVGGPLAPLFQPNDIVGFQFLEKFCTD